MATTHLRLLILIQLLILPSTLCEPPTGKVERDVDDYVGFLESPVDTEYTNQKEIALKCRYSVAVKRCIWYKDDWIVRLKNEWHVRFEFNESQGLCNIAIRRPRLGVDTSKWKCVVEKMNGKKDVTPEIVIFAKDVPRTTYFNDFASYEFMHMSQNPHKQATIHLEMLTMYETRIRWFVDDKMASSLYDEHVDLLKVDSIRVFSSTTVDLSNLGVTDFAIVRCCVEFRSELKNYKIFTIYVASNDYNADVRMANQTVIPEKFEVTAPNPFLVVDGDEVSDLMVRFQVSYPSLHETHFTCGEADAFPNSVLVWQVIATDVDAASDLLEFNRTEQALEETEMITLHSIFKHPNSRIMVACHAFNILAPKKYHKVAQIHISLEYIPPTCTTDKHAKEVLPSVSPTELEASSRGSTIVFLGVGMIFIGLVHLFMY